MTSRKHEGFRVEPRVAILDFADDSPYHGVEAKVRTSVAFETLFWFQRNAENTDAETSAEALNRFGDEFLISWNLLDDDGKPYPPTGPGVCSVIDSGLVTALMGGWIEAVVEPPAPLSGPSKNGHSSAEDMTSQLADSSVSLRD
jgi:hypothetical protein